MNRPQNWGQFLSGGSIQWDHIIISGHSQGGGHAAVIGISNPVRRVLMFASPNDHIDTLHINAPPEQAAAFGCRFRLLQF